MNCSVEDLRVIYQPRIGSMPAIFFIFKNCGRWISSTLYEGSACLFYQINLFPDCKNSVQTMTNQIIHFPCYINPKEEPSTKVHNLKPHTNRYPQTYRAIWAGRRHRLVKLGHSRNSTKRTFGIVRGWYPPTSPFHPLPIERKRRVRLGHRDLLLLDFSLLSRQSIQTFSVCRSRAARSSVMMSVMYTKWCGMWDWSANQSWKFSVDSMNEKIVKETIDTLLAVVDYSSWLLSLSAGWLDVHNTNVPTIAL